MPYKKYQGPPIVVRSQQNKNTISPLFTLLIISGQTNHQMFYFLSMFVKPEFILISEFNRNLCAFLRGCLSMYRQSWWEVLSNKIVKKHNEDVCYNHNRG